MEQIPLTIENVSKATDYLASICKLQEFNDKAVDPHQWSAPILFANQLIVELNNKQQQNG